MTRSKPVDKHFTPDSNQPGPGKPRATTRKQTTMEAEGTLKIVGWDGNSNEIIQLWMPCGCRFDKDKKSLIVSCMTHLVSPSETHA